LNFCVVLSASHGSGSPEQATEIAARLMANGEALPFSARRSAVYATHGMVACSQPAASEIGVRILQSGGNAVDAAVAIGAALNLTEGMSTGLGGDCFILFKPAGDSKVYALNGSGRAAASLTSAQVRADCAKTYGIGDPDSIEEFPGDRSASRKF
jgi:gamma-glutamyltranspeptidase